MKKQFKLQSAIILLCLPMLAACQGSSGPGSAKADADVCQSCATSADCKTGLTCANFVPSAKFCAAPSTTTCTTSTLVPQ